MDIKKIFEDIQKKTDDIVFLHDMILPISSESMYNIMADPSNWAIVNFPIIKNVEIISNEENVTHFLLTEKLLGKYYVSSIHLSRIPDLKCIDYNHSNPTFPFVSKMASTWYFTDEGESFSHFYIIRRFRFKKTWQQRLLLWYVKRTIKKHVEDYYQQLIALTKSIRLSRTKV